MTAQTSASKSQRKLKISAEALRSDLIHTFSLRVSTDLHDRMLKVMEHRNYGNASDWVRQALVDKLEREELEILKAKAEREKYLKA